MDQGHEAGLLTCLQRAYRATQGEEAPRYTDKMGVKLSNRNT